MMDVQARRTMMNQHKWSENMIQKNKTMLMAIFVLALASVAFAANVNSVTTTASTTNATTGTSVVITVVSTSDSDTVSNVQIQLVKDSGTGSGSCTGASDFSISDPASPYYYTTSVPTSGVTKTFTFTVGSCGRYAYHIAESWSGGSKSSTSETIEFISPSDLTVQSNVSAVQINTSQSFGLTIDITNTQGSQITSLYNLSVPSNLSVSGDPTSDAGKNISASSTSTLTWTITHSQCFTGSKAISLTLGDNTNASYIVVTGNSSCASAASTTTTTTASSDSSGGSTTTTGTTVKYYTGKHVVSIPSISANSKAEVDIAKSYETGVKKIIINVKNAVNNIEITVTKADTQPAEVTAPTGRVYNYLKIDKTNITDSSINNITIDFQVEKSWITANNINSSTIALSRYTTAWTKLPTSENGYNATHMFYRAVSPGLSVFTITANAVGEAANATTTTTAPAATTTAPSTTPPATTTPSTTPPAEGKPLGSDLIVGAAVAIAIALMAFFYYHGKKIKKSFTYSFNKK